MFIKKSILIFLLFVTGLYANSNQKITLYLDWLHQFQFAGYYVAKEKGYYNNFGLDVNIEEFNSNSNIVKDVMEKEVTYGVGKSSLIIDKFNGNDLEIMKEFLNEMAYDFNTANALSVLYNLQKKINKEISPITNFNNFINNCYYYTIYKTRNITHEFYPYQFY